MNLLTDSAAWLALYDHGDKYHVRAQRAFRDLAERQVNFVVTDYLIAEAITLILGRAGHATAVMCGEWLLNSPRVRIVHADFVDCLSFVVMRRERLVDAFTFDHHFEQMGFRLWPGGK